MHLMRSAAAAHHLHAARADDALPQRLIEVDRLNAGKRNLRHLYVEDAVFLHKARICNGKLTASTDNATHNPGKESQHKQSNADVEKRCLLLGVIVVSKPDDEEAAHKKQQAEQEITEDVGPVKPSLEDDCLAFFETLFDVVCHFDIG